MPVNCFEIGLQVLCVISAVAYCMRIACVQAAYEMLTKE